MSPGALHDRSVQDLLFADQLVKISIVNFFPYHFRAECPDPVSQLSLRSLLPSPSYLPHGLYLHSNSLFSISTQWGTAGHIVVSYKFYIYEFQRATTIARDSFFPCLCINVQFPCCYVMVKVGGPSNPRDSSHK